MVLGWSEEATLGKLTLSAVQNDMEADNCIDRERSSRQKAQQVPRLGRAQG